ncbi:MAG: transcriptional regulator, partial [Mycobacterium sp.]|nr:transcriptional regulator [Mycobacterium sp.]
KDEVLAMSREAMAGNGRAWWQSYTTNTLRPGLSLFVRLEGFAATINEYEPELVPGLLQTREYIEGLFEVRGARWSGEVYQGLIDIRMRRQSVWDRERPPRMEVILNEAVLRRPIGGAAVMAGQLRHILDREDISVRVLPFDVGAYLAIGTPFTLLTFPDSSRHGEPIEPPLAYIDTYTGGIALNDPDDIAIYHEAWSGLTDKALDVRASRRMITKTMKEYQHG